MNPLQNIGIRTQDPTWLADRTIYLCRSGSRAYGLQTPQSDFDYKGILVPPREVLFGFRSKLEQVNIQQPEDQLEGTIFTLAKFMAQSAEANPNLLEMLWIAPEDQLWVHPAMATLFENRSIFLSRRLKHSFAGYAASQLKRIRAHRRWLLEPRQSPPERAEFGLPERTLIPKDQLAAAHAAITKQLDQWNLGLDELSEPERIRVQGQIAQTLAEMKIGADAQYAAAGRTLGFSENFIELLDQERRYGAAMREWHNYLTWKTQRNPKRAELEARYGYDTKHAMHLVRLIRMCSEVLLTGQLQVRRADADELLAIRDGGWSYDALEAWAATEERRLDDAFSRSPLPSMPPLEQIEALCVQVTQSLI